MTALIAVLVSGVLLGEMDVPIPNCPIAFINADSGKMIKAETDKHGKFQVDLAPGTYRHGVGTFTVGKSTPKPLKLHQRAPIDPRSQVIDGGPRDFSLRPDERARVIVPQ